MAHFKFVNLRPIFIFILNFTHPDPYLESAKFEMSLISKFTAR
ncbi:hypothetical protein CSUNSWCD_435 [Campylobacter showae CSUNSWCD]|uniref:Uncharacterized protein n=1 Tax=Campylobacter showae CSUNSWCD TaxID=1244083 RepID=M5IME2_9BACT|nr:hypothetical protein CSUNSWCD_435 [Campylobacter showae CSUNSWCD]